MSALDFAVLVGAAVGVFTGWQCGRLHESKHPSRQPFTYRTTNGIVIRCSTQAALDRALDTFGVTQREHPESGDAGHS